MSDFATFWAAYPRKVGKLAASAAWTRKGPPLAEVLAALEWQQRSEQWRRGYIPHPATYLTQGRWLDENPLLGDIRAMACALCGHPEPRWHSAVECNARWLAQQKRIADPEIPVDIP